MSFSTEQQAPALSGAGEAAAFLERHRDLLRETDDRRFTARHEAFLRGLAGMKEGAFDGLGAREREGWTAVFTACQLRHITMMEEALCRRLPELAKSKDARARLPDMLFGSCAGARLRELDRSAAAAAGRPMRLVMVGCGPLPATLFWLLERHPRLECTGIDTRADALRQAQEAARLLKAPRITFECADGAGYDYAEAGLVCMANQVIPKRRILERIAATVRRPVRALVRDPMGHGWLLAETAAARLPASCLLLRTGGESPGHFSRELVLEIAPAGG